MNIISLKFSEIKTLSKIAQTYHKFTLVYHKKRALTLTCPIKKILGKKNDLFLNFIIGPSPNQSQNCV